MHTHTNQAFVGKVLTRLGIVDSTNEYAKRLLTKTKPPEGTAIIAEFQEKGKGQFGNHWESELGENLLLSIILYPKFLEPQQIFLLNKAISLAIKDAVEFYLDHDIFIKWPNDIYYSDNKLAGILIETSIAGSKINDAVVGIGLNVNQTNFSKELTNAQSLKLILKENIDLDDVVGKTFACIEKRYEELRSGKSAKIEGDYNQSLYHFNLKKPFLTGNTVIEGRIIGVNNKGQLMIETRSGIKLFNHKEIEELKANS